MSGMSELPTDISEPLTLAGRRMHFVGIGGCGMSGLARICRANDAMVTGSDHQPSPVTDALIDQGIAVTLQQTADTLPRETDLVVISAAIKPDHPEYVEAVRRAVPVLKYAQVLGRLMIGRTGIAIAGTHGKSTTTAMLAHILIQCQQDPTFIVGATCRQIGGGSRIGRTDMLLAEACEYDRSFHNFHPTISAILNVEEDHLDIYGSLDQIVAAFNQFARRTRSDGMLLIAHEGAYRTAVAAGLACSIQTIGFAPEADWSIDIDTDATTPHVQLAHHGEPTCSFNLTMPGEHMAFNASVAVALACQLGAAPGRAAEAISRFEGLDRRMQYLGEINGVKVVDDYGHHPTEIATTLRALRRHYLSASGAGERAPGRLICVFQPHQHSRTRFLLDQFATSFTDADLVIVPPIYFVRDSEEDRRAVNATDLVERLGERDVQALHIEQFNDIATWLTENTRPGDLVVIMGAGPVWQVAHRFVGLM